MKLALLKIDVFPTQAAELRSAQAGEDRGQEQRPPAALSGPDNGLNLFPRRNVDANLELASLATLGLPLGAPAAGLSKVAHDVARDEAALLRIAQQRGQRDANLADHGLRARLRLGARRHIAARKLVLEFTHHRRRELGKLHIAEVRLNVKLQVLAIGRRRRAL